MSRAATLYRLLGEDVRLRLLWVLSRERLNVSELTAVLGIAQSGVSRHLGLLKDEGLVAEEPAGGFTYFRLGPAFAAEPLAGLWAHIASDAGGVRTSPDARADEARLQEVLRLRRENFDPRASDTGQIVPGRSWAAWARALGHLLPPLDVADLGCGEGYLTVEIARWAGHVTAVDANPAVLSRARALARRRGASNITWKRGDLARLPLADAAFDLALLSQSLHQAADPAAAVSEAVRILKPGGRLLVLELRPHDQAWVAERLGDRWLGFADDALEALLGAAGLDRIRVQLGARKAGGPFAVTIASGQKPAAGRPARRRRPTP